MSYIINYIKTNCYTRQSCLACIMNFYSTFKFRPELQFVTESRVFDAFADKNIKQNQEILSNLYIYINDGKIVESLEHFNEHL